MRRTSLLKWVRRAAGLTVGDTPALFQDLPGVLGMP
jgi:hypothetical protein